MGRGFENGPDIRSELGIDNGSLEVSTGERLPDRTASRKRKAKPVLMENSIPRRGNFVQEFALVARPGRKEYDTLSRLGSTRRRFTVPGSCLAMT